MAIENIANDLQALINVKRDMKNALIEKNSIPSGGVVTYADAIRAISTESFSISSKSILLIFANFASV